MTKRSITVNVYIGKCWNTTRHYLAFISMKKHRGEINQEYDRYSIPIIKLFRETEKEIIRTNKFNNLKYDAKLKKVIAGVKNKYNDKNILWASLTSSPIKKPHLK